MFSVQRAGTMAVTAAAGKDYLDGEQLGDTRQVTGVIKKSKKGSMKRAKTMDRVVAEAQWVIGKDAKLSDMNAGRQLRKRAPRLTVPAKPKKPALKRPGTMVRTAKEGSEYLKRGRKGKKGKKVAPPPAQAADSTPPVDGTSD